MMAEIPESNAVVGHDEAIGSTRPPGEAVCPRVAGEAGAQETG